MVCSIISGKNIQFELILYFRMGAPSVTTPSHYDLVHNFYTQVCGKKRFILFPPDDFWYSEFVISGVLLKAP